MNGGESRRIGAWRCGELRVAAVPVDRWVVKFGGSLLLRPRWPQELVELVAGLPGAVTVVVGGGPVVDGLRAVDAACPRPAHVMHALAIEAMGITARMVAEATALPLVATASAGGTRAVLDAPAWLTTPAQRDRLPVGWHVTSDSIAATVAHEAAAGLLLAKRRPPPVADLAQLVAAGWIDPYLPVAAEPLVAVAWAVPDAAA